MYYNATIQYLKQFDAKDLKEVMERLEKRHSKDTLEHILVYETEDKSKTTKR